MEQITQAKLVAMYHSGEMDFFPVQFNPGEYTLEKSAQIAEVAIPGLDAPLLQFVRGQSEKLTVDLFFDTTEEVGVDGQPVSVTTQSDKVYGLMKIESRRHAPPICAFMWNDKFPGCDIPEQAGNQRRTDFQCVVESVRQKFTMFSPTGIPLRATLSVTLREYKTLEEQLAQLNLNSPDRTHSHVLKRGETLSMVAGNYYRNPGEWRPIADKNGIEDPRRLDVGSFLEIPPIE